MSSDGNRELAREPRPPSIAHTLPADSVATLDADHTGAQAIAPDHIGPGQRVYHYELIRELGRGGMGVVYLARDTKLGRRVAIKFLDTRRRQHCGRFVLEARTTARCMHENIVVIHEVNEFQGTPFMVLEYLKGQSLSEFLDGTPLPIGKVAELMVPVLRALACAHQAGIVHRDLKPENIIMTDTGVIKVLDFGIAKLLSQDDGDDRDDVLGDDDGIERSRALSFSTTDLTQDGALVGTVPFMSPEQWGLAAVDHRADLWAAGILLYVMVSGRHPLAPLSAERMATTPILGQPMPSVRQAAANVPADLAELIDSCLVKRKEERLGSAEELLAGVERYLPRRYGRATLELDAIPYAGLSAFQEGDADRFFGRSRDVAAMVSRLGALPLVGVVGPSGVGKSSFIRAGVIPALKNSGQAWEAVVMRPGHQPLVALAQALVPFMTAEGAPLAEDLAAQEQLLARLRAEPGYLGALLRNRARSRKHRILLFIDQFEELYTLADDPDESRRFVACLLGVADDTTTPLRVVLSIRSDFLDRVAENRSFMSELAHGLYFLPPPDRGGLREALVHPAEMAGFRFESDEMVEDMLDALESAPGALPLLQFTAAVLWDLRDRERRLLTRDSYARIGGVAGALAGHADAMFDSLLGEQQQLARAMFRRLVTPERTRDIVEMGELRSLATAADDIEEVVSYFVDARLLVVHQGEESDNPLVEIVHESLISSWPALRHWLDENQEAAAFLADLRTAAKQWRSRDRSPGMLWRGDAVERARRLHELCADETSEGERDYLQAVFALHERAARRRRRLIFGTITFLSALIVAAAVALITIRNAEKSAKREAARALAASRVAEERYLALQESQRQNREQHAQLDRVQAARDEAETKAKAANELAALTKDELIAAVREARKARHRAEEARALAERQSKKARDAAAKAEDATTDAEKARAEAEEAARREKAANAQLQRLIKKNEARIKKLEGELADIAEGPLRE